MRGPIRAPRAVPTVTTRDVLWCAVVAVMGLGPLGAVAAQDRRVALADPGASLESAVRGSLSPWRVEVIAVRSPSPGAAMPGSSAAARSLARAHHADAVVWISRADAGYALWIFDAADERVAARPLPGGPPFDEAMAAAVALSIKTLLRHSAVAPAAERWGVDTVAAEASGEPAQPAARPSNGRRSDGAPASDPPLWALRAAVGGRAGHTAPSKVELRAGLGLAWWPGVNGPLGVAVDVASGPGVGVDDDRFVGRLVDGSVVLSLALRTPRVADLAGRVEAGAGAQVALLDGRVRDAAQDAQVWRANPILRGALGVDWQAAPGFRFGLHGRVTWLGRTQRYLVRNDPLLELSTVSFELALASTLAVFGG